MSDHSPDPLDPELAALFEAESRFPARSSDSHARVWQQVQGALVALPPFASDGAEPTSAGAAPVASASPWLAAGKGAALIKLCAAAAIFVAGGVSGVLLERSTAERPEPVVVARPAPAAPLEQPAPSEGGEGQDVTVPPSLPGEPPPAPGQGSTAVGSRSRPHPEPAQAAERSSLARERSMIDAARTGIARGHADEALRALARHARDFPQGALSEERDGLTVLALARSGRGAEALEKAEHFRRQYPQSLLLPALEAQLRRSP